MNMALLHGVGDTFPTHNKVMFHTHTPEFRMEKSFYMENMNGFIHEINFMNFIRIVCSSIEFVETKINE